MGGEGEGMAVKPGPEADAGGGRVFERGQAAAAVIKGVPLPSTPRPPTPPIKRRPAR